MKLYSCTSKFWKFEYFSRYCFCYRLDPSYAYKINRLDTVAIKHQVGEYIERFLNDLFRLSSFGRERENPYERLALGSIGLSQLKNPLLEKLRIMQ